MGGNGVEGTKVNPGSIVRIGIGDAATAVVAMADGLAVGASGEGAGAVHAARSSAPKKII